MPAKRGHLGCGDCWIKRSFKRYNTGNWFMQTFPRSKLTSYRSNRGVTPCRPTGQNKPAVPPKTAPLIRTDRSRSLSSNTCQCQIKGFKPVQSPNPSPLSLAPAKCPGPPSASSRATKRIASWRKRMPIAKAWGAGGRRTTTAAPHAGLNHTQSKCPALPEKPTLPPAVTQQREVDLPNLARTGCSQGKSNFSSREEITWS